MNRLLKVLLLLFVFQFQKTGYAQTIQPDSAKMQWFADAKLGIFIHWGIYAVNGISESWSFHNGEISHADYMKQLTGFTASNYNPQQWADLIKESGASYAVLTSKHHDGVALWNSKMGGINVVKDSPAKRDLIQPFVTALRKDDIKVGLYFSLIDWSYPDYDQFTKTEKRYEKDSVRWNKFLKYYQGQLREVCTNYNPDLFWFDGDWEHSAEEWQAEKMRKMILDKNPKAIINSRLQGYGDYATPEQGVPIFKPKSPYWELCMTTNDNWGYQQRDTNYKTVNQVLDIFVNCISKGGNLLLDIGPKADGSLNEKQSDILRGVGRWVKKHSEAVYETQAGIPIEYSNFPTSLSKDSTTLYIYINGKTNGAAYLKGIVNKVEEVRVIGSTAKITTKVFGKQSWSAVPGIISLYIPDAAYDKEFTVVAVKFDGKIKLWKD